MSLFVGILVRQCIEMNVSLLIIHFHKIDIDLNFSNIFYLVV